ncbi:gliding motility-associated-like protein [Tenacibaculum gallaicum]|uniref:Gliding motility-associated-like protein n=1 Tax=Tenacibaculum gallaicum TaxID=561505 RepID=A0A3E0I0Y3_9FLAO|nr:choice-of-anchor L domain-containing protein [Tenacibaculum gallaicum]REH52377.1 gliding motility-associated-like protein [Tenacibaculum gallaicum]
MGESYISNNFTIRKRIKFFLTLIFLSVIVHVKAQVAVTPNPTAAQIATELQSAGVIITNPVITRGATNQIALFTNGDGGANLEVDRGIAFTTSNVNQVFVTNNQTGLSVNASGTNYSDTDLTTIDPEATRDVVVFEFDFRALPNYTGVLLEYQFGSEEYPDFVGSPFNDIFGFFVTDPLGVDPTIPNTAPGANLAQVPSTANPVAINNINAGFRGSSGGVGDYPGITPDLSQGALYINNGHVLDNDTNPNNAGPVNNNPGTTPIGVEFNGITRKLTANINLTPGITYHMKIAIADVFDSSYDSGVFITKVGGVPIIVAEDDSGEVVSTNGGVAVVNVLTNDTVAGITNPSASGVELSEVSSENSGITLNTNTGEVTVAPSVPAGVYELVYNLCQPSTNCDTAIVTVTVLADSDGDNVADRDDLDDDNDGILDTEENNCIGSISYEFYNSYPASNSVDDIPTTGALAIGTRSNFNVDQLWALHTPGDDETFSVRYKGLLRIDTDGVYTFYTTSDDGSKLFINGIEVVDNDGLHGSQTRNGQISLKSGVHELEVLFYERTGAESLSVEYAGPSISRRNLPFSRLSCLLDSDNDGIPNHLDLDSDNDGCYDAIEGDENVLSSHLNSDGSINIAANGGVDTNGVPVLVNSGSADIGGDKGQGIGTSTAANPAPDAGTLSGGNVVYVNNSITLTSDGNSGGVWSSSDPSRATVNASTGEVSGVLAGTVTITYTVTSIGGCEDSSDISITIRIPPTVTGITDASATEGDAVDFNFTLSNASAVDVDYTFTLTNGTAGSSDYTTTDVVVTVPAGATTGTVSVPTTEDTIDESDETFTVTSGGQSATGTIQDNDGAPTAPTVVSQTTDDTTPVITGTADSEDTITVTVNGVTYTEGDGNLVDNGDGTWSLSTPAGNEIPEGTYDVSVTATDAVGNTSNDTTTDELIIDTTAPVLTIAIDDITADNIINAVEANSNIPVTGTVSGDFNTGDIVTLVINGNTYTGAVDASGNYSISIPGSELAADTDTTVEASVSSIDSEGNRGSALNTHKYYLQDTDNDGIPDVVDVDDDNDGIPDVEEGDGLVDTDGDGIPDSLDLDSDNDGINDVIEGGNGDLDTNGDGVIDSSDTGYTDTNGDGQSDNSVDEEEEPDTDGDGIPDYQDLDSDNDGINDVIEGGNESSDTNGDGVIDSNDTGGSDSDGDGISDSVDGDANNFGEGDNGDDNPVDTDGDSVPDYQDLDSDDDGINDVVEGGNSDEDGDGQVDNPSEDTDGDGIADSVDGFDGHGDANSPDNDTNPTDPNSGGNGVVNDSGVDSDGDGIADSVDGFDGFGDAINDDTCVKVNNLMSPNGDSANSYLHIDCIENFPNNTLEIFNRWGNTVYRIKGYNNSSVVFRGISEGRANINVGDKLPVGTYFYILDLGNGSKVKKGWIYINR